jgi:arabinogalactan endo-1,4-beta-galactosidase
MFFIATGAQAPSETIIEDILSPSTSGLGVHFWDPPAIEATIDRNPALQAKDAEQI